MTREEEIRKSAFEYIKSDAVKAGEEYTSFGDFINGAEWADAHPHWISVENKLPPKKSEYDDLSNNVLATDGKEIYESVYNHDFEDWFTHDMWELVKITHWMPLPQLPKGGEE